MQQDEDASSWNTMACDAHSQAEPAVEHAVEQTVEQAVEQAVEHGEDINEACCMPAPLCFTF